MVAVGKRKEDKYQGNYYRSNATKMTGRRYYLGRLITCWRRSEGEFGDPAG